MMNEQQKVQELALAARRLGYADEVPPALADLWDAAFQAGRLAALDEFQDRFCVCMK